ncbi:MAG TPA: TraR/DksA C4-type zinc finger protein [Jatrophihabitans sp.]|nr:TraR/DksA C4-type zinc finger protein [Jatrophihabitans sp.]
MVIRFYPGADGGPSAVELPGFRPSGHTQFDTTQLRHFRDALTEQRGFRLEQLRQLAEAPASGQLSEVTAALRTAAHAALAEIDGALGRLRDGSYGRCLRCGHPVQAERLEILPAAALCMPCQHAAESPAD